jgi:TolA-binding protein
LKVSPNHPDALYNLGAIYGNLGNGRLARDNWDRLLAVSPKSESALRARSMLSQLPAEPQASGERLAGRTSTGMSGQ